jgi:alpha-tubulin suppressor-like RCC1 family protein
LPAIGRWTTAWDLEASLYARVNDGLWGLRLRAVDGECVAYGEGCAEVELPLSGAPFLTVTLAPSSEEVLCDGQLCSSGRCHPAVLPAARADESCDHPSLLDEEPRPRRLALGERHSCVVIDGGVWCWGENDQGRLGNGSGPNINQTSAVSVELDDVVTVAAGTMSTCALTEEGRLWCWGWNRAGQVGDGSTDNRNLPVAVLGLPNDANIVEVAVGAEHSCARTDEGAVYCWGDNTYGQLGEGTTRRAPQPRPVLDVTDATALWAEGYMTCVANGCGQLRCWGINAAGQRGDGDIELRSRPGDTILSGVVDWAGGHGQETHACAVAVPGEVWCWGSNQSGQLGDGTRIERWEPARVLTIVGARQVGVGQQRSCALDEQGQVFCWGRAEWRALGQSGAPSSPSPAAMGGVEELAVGDYHACARHDRHVWCWGHNGQGQLGDGTTNDRSSPGTVLGLPEADAEEGE